MAALSAATVVVEAGARSGSINVARLAHDLGRFVGAVPGPVTSATSAGTHTLLWDGRARIVTDAASIALLHKPGHANSEHKQPARAFRAPVSTSLLEHSNRPTL